MNDQTLSHEQADSNAMPTPTEAVTPGEALADALGQPGEATDAAGDLKTPTDPQSVTEVILFASDTPLSAAKIAQVGGLSGAAAVTTAIDTLNAKYDEMGVSFIIKAIAGGFQLQSRPEYEPILSRLFQDRKDQKLSQAAMETLAIIAYRQPILRADIEAIRGVACGEVLRGLMEKQMVKIVGRANVLGRPMLYGTTKKFLEVFGISGLDDLPNAEDLRRSAYNPDDTSDAQDAPETAKVADDVTEAPAQGAPDGDTPDSTAT
jgi:segregation and condensation protein B